MMSMNIQIQKFTKEELKILKSLKNENTLSYTHVQLFWEYLSFL